ncbi:hypothetical protein [Nevskia ramosa]|uniref:hypothetical protein n=1 Tax=Nevskia ramosa TaxID=64002 RepID=UPI003D0EB8B3
MRPLADSHAADAVEEELKALFIRVFEETLRPVERRINALGMPHVGDFALIERSIKADGLAMYRGADRGAMRYLYKAWRSNNPRRGLGFMRTYLQLLFPNSATIVQQWQDKSKPYPTALSDIDGGNHFLTSRVSVRLPSDNAIAVLSVVAALRSTVPARILLTIQIISGDEFTTPAVAVNGSAGLLLGQFIGTIV